MLVGGNMKKIFLMVCLLFFAGCSINYDLKIDDDNYYEKTEIIGDRDSLYNTYFTKPLPLSKEAPIQTETDEKVDGVKYYDVKDISNSDFFGLEFNGTFGKGISLSKSNILAYGSGIVSVSRNESTIEISVPTNLKVFRQYDDLDELKVTIHCKYKSISNNADSVNGNDYVWIINRENYETKKINFVYNEDSVIDSDFFKENPIIMFAIFLFSMLIICFFIYLFLKKIYFNKNSLS